MLNRKLLPSLAPIATEFAKVVALLRWRGFVIRAFCPVIIRALRWRGFGFAELAKVVALLRWRGFVIRALGAIACNNHSEPEINYVR